jgi:hypothetical protein
MEWIDATQISQQLRSEVTQAREWISSFLTMWLVDDHGVVNTWGHLCPDVKPGVPRDVNDAVRRNITLAKYLTLEEAIVSPTGNEPFAVQSLPSASAEQMGFPAGFVVSFRFRSQPHDLVALLFTPGGRVVRMLWLVG